MKKMVSVVFAMVFLCISYPVFSLDTHCGRIESVCKEGCHKYKSGSKARKNCEKNCAEKAMKCRMMFLGSGG